MTFLEGMFWFSIGAFAATYFWRWAMSEMLDQLMERVKQEVERTKQEVITMKIELVDNLVMCYNADNNEFVCQGSTIEEVMDNFIKRYPTYTGVLTADENDAEARAWIKSNRARIGQQQES
jgi:hypothetical protein